MVDTTADSTVQYSRSLEPNRQQLDHLTLFILTVLSASLRNDDDRTVTASL